MTTPSTMQQPFTLLRTKLHKPQVRSEWVRRPRLEKQFERGLRRRLTLVSAPAGFGKSSLVASSLSISLQRVAWLSLDESDNDPVRFWTYVIAAIQAVEHDACSEARQMLASPQLRNTNPAVISLLNEISELSSDLILILDDYHVIEAEQVHADMSFLLDHQPANLHIVLIGRSDPPISLARLRAHGQLVEIRAKDLEFSSAEAATLLNEATDLALSPHQIQVLSDRTEGWIVGLQLAALSLRGHSTYETFLEHFAGSHQFVLDYLVEEVLCGLSGAQRLFLLRTSILGRFCGALCHAVTGDANSQKFLDDIRQRNLFLIPLDNEGLWFRYHHLFAEVLYALLKRDYPGEIRALQANAATWFDREGHFDEAVDFALLSGDETLSRELVLRHWLPALHRGEVATVLRWLDALPENIERDDPSLSLARCWALFVSGQSLAVEPHLERASSAYDRQMAEGGLNQAESSQTAAQLAMMRSVLARSRGDHVMSVAHAERAAQLLPQENLDDVGTTWNMLAVARAGAGDFDGAIEAYEQGIKLSRAEGNWIGAYGCTYGQAMYLMLQGRLNEAEKLCHATISRAVSDGHGELPAAGWLYIAMARIALEREHLAEAEAFLNTGLRITAPGGFGEAERAGRYLRAHLAASCGDLNAADALLQDIERILVVMEDPYLIGELNREWSLLLLKAGDLDGAGKKLSILEEKTASTQHAHLLLGVRYLLPRLRYAQGRYQEACSLLAESIHSARAMNCNGELLRLLPLLAVTLDALGDRVGARSACREALALGVSEGYVRRWLDAGPGIASLLRDAKDRNDAPKALHRYLDLLLDGCRSNFGAVVMQPQRGLSDDLLDPLTARELEVARLICDGLSGPEIANELVLAYNTVRKHISNIYSKLGVRSRSQAIARLHELDLF